MSESLYRKYRPLVFKDVVGQDHIIRTLQNSIEANKVSHAYLFCGPRGTGKTTTARILAKALLCEKGPTTSPDGTCEDCQMIAKSTHPDVSELDAASRTGVENVRDEIISRVGYAPVRGQYKVYVIDEVHMLSNAAFNALLKTLEEPPSHIVFVLCTTDPQKVPETIRSRCQRFDFRAINTEELTARLGAVCEMENVPYEGEALELIAQRSNGGLRDALTALEQTIAFGDNKVTLSVAQDMFGKTDVNDLNELVCAIAEKNMNKCLEFVNAKVDAGVDFAQFVEDFAERMRDVYVMKLSNCDVSVSATHADIEQIKQEASLFDEARLSYILSLMNEVCLDLKTASNQRLAFELAIFKMLDETTSQTLEALNARVTALENSGVRATVGTPERRSVNAVSMPTQAINNSETINVEKRAVSQTPHSNATVSVPDKKQPVTYPASDATPAPAVSEAPTKPDPPVPTQATSAGRVDFRTIWKQTLDTLRSSNPAIFSLLDSAHGKFNQPSKTITLNIEEGRTFAFNNLSKTASKSAIISALEASGLAGATVNVVMVEGKSEEQAIDVSAPISQNFAPPVEVEYRQPSPVPPVHVSPVADNGPVPVEPISSPQPGHGENVEGKASFVQNMPPAQDVQAEPQPATDEVEKSEIDEFNDILASTFGEGTHFEEVK
jgi:DNA polymerase III subunit gamma/tau